MSTGSNGDELREIMDAYGKIPDRSVDRKGRLDRLKAIQQRLMDLPQDTPGLDGAKDQVADDVRRTEGTIKPKK